MRWEPSALADTARAVLVLRRVIDETRSSL